MMSTTLRYSQALVLRAVAAFWWRTVGWKFVLALVAVAVCLGYMLAVGDRSWFVGWIGAVLVMGLAFPALLYLVHLRGALGRFHRMRQKEATLQADSQRLTLASDAGASQVLWSAITEIWRFDEFWLLFFTRAQFVTLPLVDLDAGLQDFIVERVRSHGGRVA